MLGLELVSGSQIGVGCEELLKPAGPTADLEKGPAPDRTQLQNPAVLLCPDVSKIKKTNPNQAALLSLGLAKALRAD